MDIKIRNINKNLNNFDFGPLRSYLFDDSISVIDIRGIDKVFVTNRKELKKCKVDCLFNSEAELLSFMKGLTKIFDKDLGDKEPVFKFNIANTIIVLMLCPPIVGELSIHLVKGPNFHINGNEIIFAQSVNE